MCYIVYFVIYGMVVFAHPTDPAVQALLFLSPENGGETVRAFPAVLAVVPSPSRAVPAWPCPCHRHWESPSTWAGMGTAGAGGAFCLIFPQHASDFPSTSDEQWRGVLLPQPPPSGEPILPWSRAPGPPTPDDKVP